MTLTASEERNVPETHLNEQYVINAKRRGHVGIGELCRDIDEPAVSIINIPLAFHTRRSVLRFIGFR